MEDQEIEKENLKKLVQDKFSTKDVEFIGSGSTGYCFKFETKFLGARAIKIAKPKEIQIKANLKNLFLEEIAKLSEIKHKNVILIFDLGEFSYEGNELPYFVMEYFEFDLLKLMRDKQYQDLNRDGLISILLQSAEGLVEIHRKNVAHSDIKESNIFIDSELNVKIGDLGFAKKYSVSSSPDSQHGTFEYWGEEQKKFLQAKSDENLDDTMIIIAKKDRKPKWDIIALGFVYEHLLNRFKEKSRYLLSSEDEKYLYQLSESMKLEESGGISSASEIVSALSKLKKTLWSSLEVPELTRLPRAATIRIPEADSIFVSRRVMLIINHPWFQRLKNVKQLGLAHLVYPGAVHTRLEHSLGVFHKTIEYINALLADVDSPYLKIHIDDYKVKVLLLSALLHDLGHFPFAHSFEEYSDDYRHLDFSMKFIDGTIVKIAPELKTLDQLYEMPFSDIIKNEWGIDYQDIQAVLNPKKYKVKKLDEPICRIFNFIIDSPIDVDKIDYTIRDSLHVGVSYGKSFDFDRFLQGVTYHEAEKDKIVLLEKAKVPVETLLVARYAMYKDVYKHHAVRSSEAMLNHAVCLFLRKKKAGIFKKDYKKKLFNKIFLFSDDQLMDWLAQEGPNETKNIINRIKNRKLYKRLVVLRKKDPDHASAFRKITKLKWKEGKNNIHFLNFHKILLKKLNKDFDVNLKEEDVVIDVPDPEKDIIEDICILPEYSEKPVHLLIESDIFKMIQDNFQNWVHKIRIFVEEKNRDKIYNKVKKKKGMIEFIDFDKINETIDRAIEESI